MTKKISDMTSEEILKHRAYQEVTREARSAYIKRWRKENPKRNKAVEVRYKKKYYAKLKLDAFTAYGGVVCSICGETNIDKLSIDHSFGDGKEHRQELFGDGSTGGGHRFYLWLRKNNYPQDLGLRVLCISCNLKEGPHTPKGPRKVGLFRDYDWLYKRYVIDNRSLHELEEECGVSYVTIYNQLVDFGIPRKKSPRFKGINGPFRTKEWLYQKYIVEGLTAKEIGELCPFSPSTALILLKKHNITRRRKGGRKFFN